jgi:acetylornithine deacetylase/succinyl-diaminopimelate desuccinylase-like protein
MGRKSHVLELCLWGDLWLIAPSMQKVIDYLKTHEKRFVRELCDYVRFPSVSAQARHKKDLRSCAEWLVAHCREIGLNTRLCRTVGNPIIIARTPRHNGAPRPHYLIYGHYDVQPPEPFDLWDSPPFEARIKGRSLFGRGASDNKGQNLAHLKAVEAYLKTSTPLPCDLTFLLEGEEEVGSTSLAPFLQENREELRCDGVVISDTGMPKKDLPSLTYALRGIAALEIVVRGPSRDLHSGIFGGSVENPAMALCQMLACMRDKRGRITIPGFYDDVVRLTKYERAALARLPLNGGTYKRFVGVKELYGEKGYTSIEHRSARPTFEINGMTSGYQGEGSKTIVPSWARAKITMRLVPNQDPEKIVRAAIQHFKKLCPPSVTMEILSGHGAEAYLVSPRSPQAQAALRALQKAFGCKPALLREGGSIPIVNQFKRILGADTLLLGLGLPDDNPHSPNEKFDLDCFAKGQLMSAHLWQELGKLSRLHLRNGHAGSTRPPRRKTGSRKSLTSV